MVLLAHAQLWAAAVRRTVATRRAWNTSSWVGDPESHVQRLSMRVPSQVVELRLGALWTNAKATHERDRFISGLETVFVNLRQLSFGVPPWTPLHVQLQRVTHLTLEIPRDYTFSANESGCSFTCPALSHFAMENVSDVSFVTDTLFNVLSTCAVRKYVMNTCVVVVVVVVDCVSSDLVLTASQCLPMATLRRASPQGLAMPLWRSCRCDCCRSPGRRAS